MLRSRRRRRQLLVAAAVCQVLLLAQMAGCSVAPAIPDSERPADWAQPLDFEPAIPNLHRVSASLYRSAQPTAEGLRLLGAKAVLFDSDAPVSAVLSLRTFRPDAAVEGPAQPAAVFERIPMLSWHPNDGDTIRFLRFVTDPSNQPVLVHCKHGADRTGAMVAIYRVVVEGWTKEGALEEMTSGGYGFHPVWGNLIRYVAELDVDAIKAQLAAESGSGATSAGEARPETSETDR
jgi:hypothetical protein